MVNCSSTSDNRPCGTSNDNPLSVPTLENPCDPMHDRENPVETPVVTHEIRYRMNTSNDPAQAVTTGLRSRRVDVVPHGRGISPPTLACRPEGVAEPSVSMNSVPMRGISSRRHVWHRCRIRSRRPSEEPRIGECRSPNTRTPFIWPIPPSAQTVAAPTTADSVTGTFPAPSVSLRRCIAHPCQA